MSEDNMLKKHEIDKIRHGADREDARIDRAIDRVYDMARQRGADPLAGAKIASDQRDRMARQRGEGDLCASGIRRSDALAMRDRGDVATRKRIRRDASEASADRAYDDLRRMRRELDAIDRAIAIATGKTRRELKNKRRAMRHAYDLAYGALARIDRSALTGDARDPRHARQLANPISPQYGELMRAFGRSPRERGEGIDSRGIVIPTDRHAMRSPYSYDDPRLARDNARAIARFVALARQLATR